jgi:hypothetical protein
MKGISINKVLEDAGVPASQFTTAKGALEKKNQTPYANQIVASAEKLAADFVARVKDALN